MAIGKLEKKIFFHYAFAIKRMNELEVGSDAWEEERVIAHELEDVITDCFLDCEFNDWLDRSPFKGEVDYL